MVSTTRNVKSILEGNGPQNWGDNVLGDDPLAAFDQARTDALAAVRAPGAMAHTVTTRQGERPAVDYAIGQLQEMLVHGWDLAKATGQDTAMDPELVEVGYARALAPYGIGTGCAAAPPGARARPPSPTARTCRPSTSGS